MKYLGVWLFGALVGAAAAAVLVYYNPLTERGGGTSFDGAWALEYDFPDESAIAFTHDGHLNLPAMHREREPLWERSISALRIDALTLNSSDGVPTALVSRISAPSPETDLLLRGVVVSDLWLISVPGQGSLVVHGENNLWPLLKDSFVHVGLLRGEWRGPAEYAVTAGPIGRGAAEVYGVSGRFAGLRGTAGESYELRGFDREKGIEAMRGKLAIRFDEPTVSDEAFEPAHDGLHEE
jgi:hypothetical protein